MRSLRRFLTTDNPDDTDKKAKTRPAISYPGYPGYPWLNGFQFHSFAPFAFSRFLLFFGQRKFPGFFA